MSNAKGAAATIGSEDVITILGRRGSGKTTLCRALQAIFPRAVVFDRLREYQEPESETVKTVSSFDAFAAAIQAFHDKPKFRIIYQFDIDRGADDLEFNEALRVVYHMGNCLVVVEEVHNFATPQRLPRYFREALLTGRHQGLSLMATTQRPGELHKTLLSQSAHIFAGSIHETNDLRYLSGFMADEAGTLQELPKGSFLHFRPGEKSQVLKIFS